MPRFTTRHFPLIKYDKKLLNPKTFTIFHNRANVNFVKNKKSNS